MLLYYFNVSHFSDLNFWEISRLYFVGLRFDLSALVIANLPVIILMTLPFHFKYNIGYQKVVNVFFIFFNSIFIGLNLIDVIYFRFIGKRSTSEIFQFLGNSDENIGSLLIQFLGDFWYMFVIFLIFIFFLYRTTRYFVVRSPLPIRRWNWYFWQSCFFIFCLALSLLAVRGGTQLKPITLVNAAKYTSIQNVPIVLNTPFCIIKTINKKPLQEKNYFEKEELDSIYSPIHNNLKINRFIDSIPENPNFVIIILESFGEEMIVQKNTPFLSSLLSQSLVFDGFANGRRSIEALPSIFASLPSLMEIDYSSSVYAGNKISGLGSLLKNKGYTTLFFHGGNNGTMSFDSFSKSAGFDYYFGRNEYGNEDDFDGKWGIFDEPFLQYTSDELNTIQQPFIASIFTLSSHHPYTLPDGFQIDDETLTPFEKSVRYSDHALELFFLKSKHYDWFDNTIFIITADHSHPEPQTEYFKTSLGMYAIPIAFYSPKYIIPEERDEVAQHIDIMPSILALSHYDSSFFAFGRNIFDSIQKPFSVNFINQTYQYSDGKYLLQNNGEKTNAIFDISNDKLLKNNILYEKNQETEPQENQLKAIIQWYNNSLIYNKLSE